VKWPHYGNGKGLYTKESFEHGNKVKVIYWNTTKWYAPMKEKRNKQCYEGHANIHMHSQITHICECSIRNAGCTISSNICPLQHDYRSSTSTLLLFPQSTITKWLL